MGLFLYHKVGTWFETYHLLPMDAVGTNVAKEMLEKRRLIANALDK
jgi:hypothetical protein